MGSIFAILKAFSEIWSFIKALLKMEKAREVKKLDDKLIELDKALVEAKKAKTEKEAIDAQKNISANSH